MTFTSSTAGVQLTTPVREVGYVRFKLTFGAQVALAPTSTPSPAGRPITVTGGVGQTVAQTGRQTPDAQQRIGIGAAREISDGVVAGVSTSLDAGHLDDFIAQPTSRGFATALFGSGFNASITVDDWAVLQVGTDSDFCFFSIGANIAPTLLQRHIGAQTASASGNVTLSFGPSWAAWMAIATRIGPQFMSVAARWVPSIAPEAASGTLGPFATWIGPIGWAIPIGIAIRDFTVMICQAAYARGLQRGHMNQVGVAYVRFIYGMRQHRTASRNAVDFAERHARDAIARFGAGSMQRYLERHYRDGRHIPVRHSQAGNFDDVAVNDLGFRFGEALFNSEAMPPT